MAKQQHSYSCSNCSHKPIKWVGCCPSCNTWGTVVEVSEKTKNNKIVSAAQLTNLSTITSESHQRMVANIEEWDRVLGGGILPGSLIILTGDPGIGKSTLLLQIAHQLSTSNTIFYFSSEESLSQVKQRAQRLNCNQDTILFSDDSNIDRIIAVSEEKKPDIIIVDSIQNCYHSQSQTTPGSISQLRESAFLFMRLAKEHNIAVILTGHITKDGYMAGPKMLEHMVDAVFYLQGEDRWQTRILRSVKNRFGAINELGFFNMEEKGLKEVPNINQHLLSEASFSPGSSLISYIEGTRPLLIELQALVVPSKYGMPQRVVTGIDHKQVVLIAAILEKHLHIKFSEHDIFFKISGGFKIKDSAADLGIALALLSSFYQKPLAQKTIALGEISLTGTVKPINRFASHVKEAEKFGIKQLLTSHRQKIEKTKCNITSLKNVYELLPLFE